MATPDQTSADPLTLLPTVLSHLKSLQRKPALATSVFAKIRNAFRTSGSQPFITPLLPRLTVIALTSPQSRVRNDAANTCAALLRALVSRRVNALSAAYVEDLVALAHRLINTTTRDPPSCELRTYCQLAKSKTDYDLETESNSATLPISSQSLESILYLLSLFLPTTDSQGARRDFGHTTSQLSSTRLWVCIGTKARNGILELAASYTVLSGRCGETPSRTAMLLLRQALGQSSMSMLPLPSYENIRVTVEELLREDVSPHLPDTAKRRKDLYRIAQLASPENVLSPDLWTSCGIREASGTGVLSEHLMKQSKQGLVRPYYQPAKATARRARTSEEPPQKKRRLSQSHADTSADNKDNCPMEASQPCGEVSRAVAGLQRTLQQIESIYVCLEDSSSMSLLANSLKLAADSWNILVRDNVSFSEPFEEWITFTTSLSLITRDLSTNLHPKLSRKVWIATFHFCEGIVLLTSALHNVRKLTANSHCRETTILDPILTAVKTFLMAFSTVFSTAVLALESVNNFPAFEFGELLAKVSDIALTRDFEPIEIISFAESCSRLHEFVLKEDNIDAKSHASLVRGSIGVSFAASVVSAVELGTRAVPFLIDIISTKVTTTHEVIAAAAASLGDAVCMKVGCRGRHGSQRQGTNDARHDIPSLDTETWGKCRDAIEPYLNDAIDVKVTIGSLKCFGSLGVHSPPELIGEVLSKLWELLWCHNEQQVRDLTYYYMRESFRTRGGAMVGSSKESSVSHSSNPSHALATSSGSGDVEGSRDESFISVLRKNFPGRVEKWNEAQEKGTDKTTCGDGHRMALAMRLFTEVLSYPKLTGLTIFALLSSSLREYSRLDEYFFKEDTTPEKVRQVAVSTESRALVTWFHMVRAIALHSGYLEHYGDEDNLSAQTVNDWRRFAFRRSGSILPSLSETLVSFLTSRFGDWLPVAVSKMLDDATFTSALAKLLTDGDSRALWTKVPRHTAEVFLEGRNLNLLDMLASKAKQSRSVIVEQISADVLAKFVMNQADESEAGVMGSDILISNLFKQPLKSVLSKRAGKIVQKLVMGFGTFEEDRAKRGIFVLSKTLRKGEGDSSETDEVTGAFLSQHFMLVMDAVNRGLFHSKASPADRFRYLRILEVVVFVSSVQLHSFVPKILATLKLALQTDRGDQAFRRKTLMVWMSFLNTLGPSRILPHLGSILSTLLPFYSVYIEILSPGLLSMVENCAGLQMNNRKDIVLLLKVIDHTDLAKTAAILETNANNAPSGIYGSQSQSQLKLKQLLSLTKSVRNVIMQLKNGTIEVLSARYLLRMLQKSRELLCSAAAQFTHYHEHKSSEEVTALASIAGSIVDLLTKTKTPACQEALLQCIGEIGAIDPALVAQLYREDGEEVQRKNTAVQTVYPTSVHALVAVLLDDFLVPTLTKGEQRNQSRSMQNRIGLVIQELLRVCGCEKDTAKRAKKNPHTRKVGEKGVDWDKVLVGESKDENAVFFWENLLPATRNVAEPFLDEPFDVQHYRGIFGANAAGEMKLACQPVWAKVKMANSAGQLPTAQEWRRQIVVQLVDYVGKQGKFGEVLKALRPVLRYEDDVAGFMFPLVIATTLDIQIADRPTDVIRFITAEMAEVLEEGSSPQPLFDLLDTLRQWRDQKCNAQARATMMTNPDIINSVTNGAISSRRKMPVDAYAELEKDQDPLSAFVDLDGRESGSLSLFLQARSAFRAKSFSRAVMMAESHIRNMRRKKGLTGWPSFIEDILGRKGDHADTRYLSEAEALKLLQRAFAELEDSRNMEAIAALRGNSSLAEQVLDCEAAGRYHDALTTYERAIASEPHNVQFHDGFMNCLMTLGHWESMLSHAKGMISSFSLSEKDLREVARANGIAAAWRLGRWTEMEKLYSNSFDAEQLSDGEKLQRPSLLKASIALGEMLRCLRNGKLSCLHLAADEARKHLLISTARAAREGYSRAYPMIALLHCVSDVEDSSRVMETGNGFALANSDSMPQVLSAKNLISFASRTTSSKCSLKAREPLISVKRVTYELLRRPSDAARANLELARLAREGDNLHAATTSTHRAMSITPVNNYVRNETVLEMARNQRAQGDSSTALKTVKVEIDRLTCALNHEGSNEKDIDFARDASDRLCTALVTAGCWLEETREEASEVILSYFDRAAEFGPSREEPFYSLGRHYDSLLQASTNTDDRGSGGSGVGSRVMRRSGGRSDHGVSHHSVYVPLIIKSFTQALVNGHTRIFEALPRMLTVWLDYHTELDDANGSGNAALVEHEVKQEMKRAFDSIPGYMWMTAVPQLMSRILHPRKQVREDLTILLAKLVCVFPDQCFWTILPSSQLKTVDRKRAAVQILNQAMTLTKKKGKASEAREKAKVLRSRIQSALSVVNSFVSICSNLLPKEKRGRRENCASEFSGVKAFLRTNMEMNPIIPTLDSLTTRLPFGEGKDHRPYAEDAVRIVDIEDHVLVMVSLMRPRRIGLVGSDGRCYRYLAKKETQGDMRKDSRLVELITVVNRLLGKNASSRGKKLGLKTYAVLPLTEETGMIEWVNDLAPLRNVVRDEHTRMAVVSDTSQIQNKYQSLSHRKFLVDWAFEKFPPVLDKFFLRCFGEKVSAEAWLEARNAWTESTGVWSMVGYVVGLGDRHGENVLIETTSGRCIHVDFAMLFDKGLKLKVPEIVPFRLTRNMVTAMGIGGYEGVFRGVSEHVLGIMRRNGDAILGVLESFLHDPLADWSRSEARVNKGGILATKEAWQTRAAVKAKLTGIVDSSGLPLSIKGQVQRLIQEATKVDNLCEMYLWWCAWT